MQQKNEISLSKCLYIIKKKTLQTIFEIAWLPLIDFYKLCKVNDNILKNNFIVPDDAREIVAKYWTD